MTSNIITNKVNLEILSGQRNTSSSVTLDKGTCVGIHLIEFKGGSPEHSIDISVYDPQGNSLIEPVDFRDFAHKGGGYLEGMKQVGFPTNNSKFSISVNAAENLATDFKAQLIFVIQRDCGCNMQ